MYGKDCSLENMFMLIIIPCLCNCMYAAHFMEKLGHKLNMYILLQITIWLRYS